MPRLNPDTRLDRLLRKSGKELYAKRTDSDCEFLHSAADVMTAQREKLRIPQRSIAIIRYLAREPMALIIPDANVTQAFNHAKQAFALR